MEVNVERRNTLFFFLKKEKKEEKKVNLVCVGCWQVCHRLESLFPSRLERLRELEKIVQCSQCKDVAHYKWGGGLVHVMFECF